MLDDLLRPSPSPVAIPRNKSPDVEQRPSFLLSAVTNRSSSCVPDHLIANNGWASFTLPSCLAPGQYLMRTEILALHSASSQGEAQFYTSCAQLNVAGSGTLAPETVSFPGAYEAADPGITTSIYGSSGQPDNGGKAYVAPGPAVVQC